MAHEIERHDRVLLHRERAWHGLGTVIDESLTPTQAIDRIGMDWEVQPWGLVARGPNGQEVPVNSHVLNMRRDLVEQGELTDAQMGVVGAGYATIQNRKLAEFAEALAEGGDVVKIETIGSIQNGKKVWFLLKGDSFMVGGKDQIWPYICLSSSHNGTSACRMSPTTIRAVCSNTLHMIIPRIEAKMGNAPIQYTKTGLVIRHSGEIIDKLDQAKAALTIFNRGREAMVEMAERLAERKVSTEDAREFFFKAYDQTVQKIVGKPTNDREQRQLDRAMSAYSSFSRRFDDERPLTGGSLWGSLNAFTGTIQHDMKSRGADDVNRVEARVASNLFGLNADRTLRAMEMALSLAG